MKATELLIPAVRQYRHNSTKVLINATQTVRERVVHLRRLMLVHSYIYYWMDSSVVSDHQWQAWANSLRDMQTMFG